ncbi:hypothetical protein L218DRAFT_428406 [Marasmius fiardii PR-910]|nr:hypothetical protein L218DRAFT_428406 [Marasmius fiardii PR-910]
MATHFFPSVGLQVLSSLVHFLGVTVVTHCLSRRLASLSLSGIFELPWSRLCILLIFIDSWGFLFTGGVLVFGVGLESSSSICGSAILLCIACYASSKVLIYLFLIERVHVVWTSTTSSTSRFKSTVDRLCYLTVAPYVVIIVLLLLGRISELTGGNQACVIGLKPIGSIPLLTYDLYINLFLTVLFFWPLFRNGHLSPRVKRLAVRTLVASIASLTTSTVNIAVLTARNGREYGWVCLGSCSADVIVNAVALYWATLPQHQRQRAPIMSIVGPKDVGGVFATGRRVSNAPPQAEMCDDGLNDLQYADHSANSPATPGSISKNSQLAQERFTALSELATLPPCHGLLKSVSRILKRTEDSKSDNKQPIEVTVTTHFEVDCELEALSHHSAAR